MGWYDGDFPRYVNAAERRAKAQREMDERRAKGLPVEPVVIEGRQIARTFWGKAWCDHIECLSDFASRLDKGKTLVRNGSVAHLAISTGRVDAIIAGTELYHATVNLQPLSAKRWAEIKRLCSGQIATQLELLQGKVSDAVMRVLTDREHGMFPKSYDFDLDCSCPDFARLCKHLAAVLYGVGARLDASPDLLFTLRGVDPFELVGQGLDVASLTRPTTDAAPTLSVDVLGDIFGIDLAPPDMPVVKEATAERGPKPVGRKSASSKSKRQAAPRKDKRKKRQ